MLNTGKIDLHKILGITSCWTLWEDLFTQNTEEYCMLSVVGRFIYTKYRWILYVERCGKIYLHIILRNIACWARWEDLFTQNTEEYCMLSTVGRFFTQNTGDYFMLNTVGRVINTKYWGILYVEYSGKIYLHKILRNIVCWARWEDYLHKILGITLCWTLWEDLFTQNTEEYCMLNTVGIFIYTKYW